MTEAPFITVLKADHCPDCGGPVVADEAGQRGCLLCGAWQTAPADPHGVLGPQ